MLQSVLDINRGQVDETLRLIAKHKPNLHDVSVAVLGIAFKPDTDDVRETPAFPIIRRLRAAGARITAYDPIARPADHEDLRDVVMADSLAQAVQSAEVVLLVTRWKEFEQLGALLRGRTPQPLVVDGRRMLDPGAFEKFEAIGRG